ncbi:MAG: hypothetical protein ACPGKS_06805 [Coraliomargarita sp.]
MSIATALGGGTRIGFSVRVRVLHELGFEFYGWPCSLDLGVWKPLKFSGLADFEASPENVI